MGYFKYISGLMQPAEFSVAIPRHKIVSPLLGVVTSYLTMELRDVWKIDFEVDKYISIKEETQLNSSYQYLIAGNRNCRGSALQTEWQDTCRRVVIVL